MEAEGLLIMYIFGSSPTVYEASFLLEYVTLWAYLMPTRNDISGRWIPRMLSPSPLIIDVYCERHEGSWTA